MKFLNVYRNSQRISLAAFFTFICLAAVLAQPTVVVTTLAGNAYKVGTTSLNTDDLVYYRFSDGFDMTAMSTSLNPEASVTRKFKVAGAKVSAYVARKSGPIELATLTMSNGNCLSCLLPSVGLFSGEHIRLRRPSWSAFTEPEFPAVLTDNKTSPTFFTPGTPWFILPVTIKAPSANTRLDLNLPDGMTVKGAIVKNVYKPMPQSGVVYGINDGDVQSFDYSSPTLMKINMTAAFGTEFNVFLIVASSTDLGEESLFSGQLYNATGQPLGTNSDTWAITHQNPHDPNVLTAYQHAMCGYRQDNPPMRYRVDFQNIGAADAQNVAVGVVLDPTAVNPATMTDVTSSHPINNPMNGPGSVSFFFPSINLKGVNQLPQPTLDETRGWVEFTVNPVPCAHGLAFESRGYVTFIWNNGNSSEIIETNKVTQIYGSNYDLPCDIDPLCTTFGLKLQNEDLETEPEQALVTTCYPTLFKEMLFVEVPPSQEGGQIILTLSDLTGKRWLEKSIPSEAHVHTSETLLAPGLPSGIYLVHVRQGKSIEVFKVIKE